MPRHDARQYRILNVLGTGGAGKVYRARLEGGSGFHKEVAVKMLRNDETQGQKLERFRDEARILGLLRDRAIIGVDAPTRLDGHWAVVMEYVDGVSAKALLKLHSRFPTSVALEVVAEVARALDKCWYHHGPEGEPLRLLHRDLKPANIQVTPAGEVKILDFGVARANFAEREARTTKHFGGTPGFIAPERLYGVEEPAGDIYSLGVVLYCLLAGDTPKRVPDYEATDEVTAQALELAEGMRSHNPLNRPNAREVERACQELQKACSGPSLRDWAETEVPGTSWQKPDELVGTVLTETPIDNLTDETEATTPSSRTLALVALIAIASAALVVVIGALILAPLL